MPPDCISLVPHSIWNARHAWTLYLTLQIIMILHHLEPKPIKSAHWTCKHEVCSTVYHIHNMPTDTAFERHKVREKILWLTKSSQTWVTWLPWGGVILNMDNTAHYSGGVLCQQRICAVDTARRYEICAYAPPWMLNRKLSNISSLVLTKTDLW